ncbi:WD repeat-containing protein 63 [Sitophilus oryzae]|uniref:WD repeat-containing protein 63 n=1 Tax=Sitophilus oryzae TaxID=7048 RepID=A0A6J2X9Q1_SITOR|nr:WD repeat-containing protein 63 [Sitophilus oryzae]
MDKNLLDKNQDDLEDKMASPKRRRKKRKKRQKDLFSIPGVRKIVMSELTQKIIECVVGEHVTSENPWKFVKKELVQDNLELHEESSEFLPVRREISVFPRPEILIGYIADETKDTADEFYICVTEEATDIVHAIIEKIKQDQEERLYYQLYKDIHGWNAMGTEEEVEEMIIKNTRPLIEVEVETRYPIFPGKVQFRLVKAQDKRDGYMELKSTEESSANIYMRRIDSSIQAAPTLISRDAQTICTYPRNSSTQYLYEIEKQEMPVECEYQIMKYANENFENLSDLLKVNGVINFYADDFDSLVREYSTQRSKALFKDYEEYMFFMDVDLCKGKMISDIYWHPMWTGIVAISYADMASNIYNTGQNIGDEVHEAVHGTNPVLIWSFKDCLKPKLILESPREVRFLSFCRFDENILIGGCKNGQLVIWDIRNKLQKVEEKEVLTTAQQKYRNYMHSLMKWMKNIYDVSVIRPTAVSNLRYSHKLAVTGLTWMDPFFEISKTGNILEAEEKDGVVNHSMQIISSSLDGSICVWDLKKKPTIEAGSYKPKRLKRLKKIPSALQFDESPFRALHLNLKPIYKINVNKQEGKGSGKSKPAMITRCSSSFCQLKYEEANPKSEKGKKVNFRERVIYKPIWKCNKTLNDIHQKIHIGTVEGNVAQVIWEGQDFDSGETVNSEQAKFGFDTRFHDGPINWIETSSALNLTLSVGGKIFALWRTGISDKPILWRRSRQMYTKGQFNFFQPFIIILLTNSGVLEKWVISLNSKEPMFKEVMSNSFFTASGVHPFQLKKNIVGLADEQGALRLFTIPPANVALSDEVTNHMKNFVAREIKRKKLFYKWQDEFNTKHENILKMKQETEKRERDEENEKNLEKQDDKDTDKDDKTGPQPGKYIEWVIKQRQLSEEARIRAMVINKKQLDTKDLEKRRKPLQKLDEENERKKRKQKQRLKEGENIFHDTVASLFPDVLKEKPIPPPDPYTTKYLTKEKQKCFENFEDLAEDADDFISTNPYLYDFSYKNLLVGNKQKFQQDLNNIHKERYDREKQFRVGASLLHTQDKSGGSKTFLKEKGGIEELENLEDDVEIAVEDYN